MKTRFIGDIHGKFHLYDRMVTDVAQSIQVGDFGVGFSSYDESDTIFPGGNHRFIRGNHDNPAACKEHPNWIADGTIEGNTMYIGGAWSFDQAYRTIGVDWWDDEQCSMGGFYKLYSDYTETKPEVMITHDCPQNVSIELFAWLKPEKSYVNVTNQGLEAMLAIHRPKLWIFGHWHTDIDVTLDGTRFLCLNEGSWIDIDTNGDLAEAHIQQL